MILSLKAVPRSVQCEKFSLRYKGVCLCLITRLKQTTYHIIKIGMLGKSPFLDKFIVHYLKLHILNLSLVKL